MDEVLRGEESSGERAGFKWIRLGHASPLYLLSGPAAAVKRSATMPSPGELFCSPVSIRIGVFSLILSRQAIVPSPYIEDASHLGRGDGMG